MEAIAAYGLGHTWLTLRQLDARSVRLAREAEWARAARAARGANRPNAWRRLAARVGRAFEAPWTVDPADRTTFDSFVPKIEDYPFRP